MYVCKYIYRYLHAHRIAAESRQLILTVSASSYTRMPLLFVCVVAAMYSDGVAGKLLLPIENAMEINVDALFHCYLNGYGGVCVYICDC